MKYINEKDIELYNYKIEKQVKHRISFTSKLQTELD